MSCFDMFNDKTPQKHVTTTTIWGSKYLGPFKGQGHYHCQRKWVGFLLIQSSSKNYDSYFRNCVKGFILLGQPVYSKSVNLSSH